MKTLFLDFDGVLHPVHGQAFVHVPALAAILDDHEVQIVVTSSYRLHEPLEHQIRHVGPLGNRVVGITPVIDCGVCRQREIGAWREEYGADDFRVPDDDRRLFMQAWEPLIL